MTEARLDVYLNERFAGRLTRARDRSVSLAYDESYADAIATTPLSLSMPKSRLAHGDDVAGAWIANLLPDSTRKLERLAAQAGIRSIEPFDLLARIGHDVAGAVQIFPEGMTPTDTADLVERSEQSIAAELRGLRADPDFIPDEFGRWSLAGQQGKIALAFDRGRWYSPTGTAASTHILKIGPSNLAGGDLAEFVTLRAAHFCLIPSPHAYLTRFDDQLAIVVERYDRHISGIPDGPLTHVRRVHQEDMCQVLGLRPGLKYQVDGGPSAKEVAAALWRLPARDREGSVQRFARLLIFNALTYSPDAHAKNYSVLMDGTEVSFAPAYDLMSNAIRVDLNRARHNTTLSMKTGSSDYDADKVTPERLHAFGPELGLPGEWLVQVAHQLALRIGDAFDLALDEVEQSVGPSDALDAMRRRAQELGRHLSMRWA